MFNIFDHYWLVAEHPEQVYSSHRGMYVSLNDEVYQTWSRNPEAHPTPVETHADVVEVMRRIGAPPYHRVYTFTIVERLAAAGLLATAETAISTDPSAKWRFTVATQVNADDVETRALLAAIGADPDEILAPEN